MWLTRLLKPISHARELLLYYTRKKVTGKLHKLTNYKSNNTSTICMKSKYKLVYGEYKPMRRIVLTRWFFSWGSRICQHASPHCVDRSLGGSAANRYFINLTHTLGATRTYPKSEGSSMTRSTSVALCSSRWASTILLTISSSEHRIVFLACFTTKTTIHQAV